MSDEKHTAYRPDMKAPDTCREGTTPDCPTCIESRRGRVVPVSGAPSAAGRPTSAPKRGVDYRHDDAPEWGWHHIERRAQHAQEAAVAATAGRRTSIGNIHALREDFLDSVSCAPDEAISRNGLEMYLRAYDEGVTEEHAKLVCAPCRRDEARLWDAEHRQWTHGTERLMVVWCRASGLFPEPRA